MAGIALRCQRVERRGERCTVALLDRLTEADNRSWNHAGNRILRRERRVLVRRWRLDDVVEPLLELIDFVGGELPVAARRRTTAWYAASAAGSSARRGPVRMSQWPQPVHQGESEPTHVRILQLRRTESKLRRGRAACGTYAHCEHVVSRMRKRATCGSLSRHFVPADLPVVGGPSASLRPASTRRPDVPRRRLADGP